MSQSNDLINKKYNKRNVTMIEKKIEAVHLIKSYNDEGRKYPKVPMIKYLVLPKCGTKYQKVEPNTNLIFINTPSIHF